MHYDLLKKVTYTFAIITLELKYNILYVYNNMLKIWYIVYLHAYINWWKINDDHENDFSPINLHNADRV